MYIGSGKHESNLNSIKNKKIFISLFNLAKTHWDQDLIKDDLVRVKVK